LAQSRSLPHTHTHSLSRSLTHTHTHTHGHISQTLHRAKHSVITDPHHRDKRLRCHQADMRNAVSHLHTLPLSLSITHTHLHTLPLSLSITHTPSHPTPYSLYHT